ncbi:type VII secretion system-associated protein [Streptomyces scabiei]|uniref:type VII secretion system-associated protein n=1 Tax=Streptomyces scabiei TaxID=1930 RepID=UPI001F4918DA|nr:MULTISPECIES: type VII secretion system-associated protein [Streptomyces]MDX3127087.1 type VII secretion system-associated protein [Streptomyces scabiei]MDX3203520.1 type VII secretion system-associated protein [Streptomyces scabiei]MDX3282483.1 type VII secretion system-associated protein [Streptomyces scabiei]
MNEDGAVRIPPVTDEMRAQAAAQPDGWVYAIDAYFDPNGEVPPYGVVGAWKVDSRGRLTGEFTHNPNYRPSPRTLGMAEPTDDVDAAIQLAAAGYGSEADLKRALLDAVVWVTRDAQYVSPVALHTSPAQAANSARELHRTAFGELLAHLPEGAVLRLNPGGSASVDIPVADLRSAT